MDNKTKYKIMKESSFSPLYYLYMSYYSSGKILGNILAFLLVATSIVIGFFTKNIVIDTIVYSISFGSYIFNYLVLKIFYNGHRTGCFTEGTSNEYLYSFKKYIGTITILSRFFEVYTPFIITFLVPNIFSKICLGLAFIAFTIFYKVSNNFCENKVSSIVKNNVTFPLIFLAIGTFASTQNFVNIKIYDNIILIFLCIIMGILKNILNKSLQDFLNTEKKAIKDPTKKIDIYSLTYLFNVNIRKLGEKTASQIEAEKAAKFQKKKEDNMDKVELAKHYLEMELDSTKKDLARQKEMEEFKKKTEQKAKEKELERKIIRGEAISKEDEKLAKEIEAKTDKVIVPKTLINDRASIRR